MALITFSGLPSSGKTRRANDLHALLTDRLAEPSYNGPLKTVVHLSDDTLHLLRSAYDGQDIVVFMLCPSQLTMTAQMQDQRKLLVRRSLRPHNVLWLPIQ
jgi:tRNA uridine 5-carbamoylmethylation protein Kti12